MKKISCTDVTRTIKEMCMETNRSLSKDVFDLLLDARKKETYPIAQTILDQIFANIAYAKESHIPLCQDTGVVIIFAELGQDVIIADGSLYDAIQKGVMEGYKEGYLRNSMVFDPIEKRINTNNNTPAYIYWDIVQGDEITFHLAPKGGGSENMSQIAMLKPSQGRKGVDEFVLQVVKSAGGNPCPPIILGIGLGGSFEQSALLSKKALFRDFSQPNPVDELQEWEQSLCEKCNRLGIGPMGLGGRTTVLAVSMLWKPCHIASMPVAVNIQCHCARHQSRTLSGSLV
ncbi:MAG: fumarate hydratase [Caldisericia bacterium]|nr:fumarate hydratase [Caldisericia bacterium]